MNNILLLKMLNNSNSNNNNNNNDITKNLIFDNLIYDNFFKSPSSRWGLSYLNNDFVANINKDYTTFSSQKNSQKSFNQTVDVKSGHTYLFMTEYKLNTIKNVLKMRVDVNREPYVLKEKTLTSNLFTKDLIKFTATEDDKVYLTFIDLSTEALEFDLKSVIFIDITDSNLINLNDYDLLNIYNANYITANNVFFDFETFAEYETKKDEDYAININSDKTDKNFLRVENGKFLDKNDNEFVFKAIGFVNNCLTINSNDYSSVLEVTNGQTDDHDDKSWKQISELGFNAVRFYLNYEMFEDINNKVIKNDGNPADYKDIAWKWIDSQIELAKKYNVKIVFNMHIPNGNGAKENGDLWTDVNAQTRLINLWRAIARKYNNEDIVAGFGLINEPNITYQISSENSIEIYEDLTNDIIEAIRSVDDNHIIFSENAICADDWGYKIYELNDSKNFVNITDDNFCYEFHHYEPLRITHNDDENTHNSIVYPNPYAVYNWSSDAWLNEQQKEKVYTADDDDFVAFETDILTPTANNTSVKFIRPYLRCNNANGGEVVKIKDFEIEIYKNDEYYDTIFNKDANFTNIFVENSVFGEFENTNDCLKITMNTLTTATRLALNDNVVLSSRWYVPNEFKYKLKCKVKATNIDASNNLVLSLSAEEYNPSSISRYNKTMINDIITNYKDIADDNNVPIFVGEFGCMTKNYQRGGDIWVYDCINYFLTNNISFNYHCYCDFTDFGLMLDNAKVNKKTEYIFKTNLKECY